MLADIGKTLRDDIERSDLDLLWQPALERNVQTHRHRSAGGDRLQGHLQTVTAENGRMEAARHRPKLVERDCDLLSRLVESRTGIGIAGHLLLQQAQLERERDQTLLRAVVQIALQPLALTLPRLDHPCPRALQLLEVSLLLGLQPAVLECDSGRRSYRRKQVGLIPQRGIVQERSHPPAMAVDQGRRSPSLAFRQFDGAPVEIHPAGELRQPVHERKRRITKRARKRIPQTSRRHVGPQLNNELPNRRPRQSSVKQSNHQCDRREPKRHQDCTTGIHSAWQVEDVRHEPESDHHQAEGERVDQQCDRTPQWPSSAPPAFDQDPQSDQTEAAQHQ